MSSSSERELEEQLLDAGNRLADPPSSVDELLLLLDRIEYCLVRVDQSPTSSMLNALSPSLNALVVDKLLHHPNDDVKVAVASCISEITRITAPDAPYDDNQMKEVFQLIVSSFVNLSDQTSRSYAKRTSILGTVSKVRSCVVMLDLECDTLIVEMFEHFLKAIREYHPDNVYSSMETIMTLVLEESEDISKELLSPILASVKNNNEVLPIARKLAESVIESCAAKVKPYLIEAVNSLGISLDDYSLVVATICDQETASAVEQGGHATPDQMGEENKLERTSSEDAMQVDKEIATGETLPEHGDPAIEKSPKSIVSNDIAQTREEESFLDSNSKMQEDSHNDQLKSINSMSNAELDNSETEKADGKVDQTTKKMGRKPSSSKAKEPSDGSHTEDEKEAKEPQDDHESNTTDDASSPCKEPLDDHESNVKDDANSPCKKPLNDNESSIKDDANSPCKEPSIDAAVSSGHEKSKELESESGNCASPFPGESLPEEGRARKAGRTKKEISSIKVTKPLESESGNTASSSPRLNIPEGRARKGGRPKKASSTTKHPAPPDGESEKLASPSPSESLLEEGSARKGGRPKKKETLSTKDSTPLENESGNATSPSPSEGGLPEEGRAQKAGRSKKVSSITKDTMPLEIESGNVASPSPSESLPEVGRARKAGRPKKKEISSIKDTLPSVNAISKQAAEATSDSEVKQTKHSGKKPSSGISNEDVNATVVASKNESGAGSDSEVNASKEPGKKVEMSGDDGDGSLKHSENKKKRGRPKTVIEDTTKSSANDDNKETVSSPKSNTKSIKDENRIEETPQTNSKRKHTPVVEKQSGDKSGEDLVGSKIKVWWPKDRKFYEGVVDFYDSAKKKHKVLYIDGDEETLNLKTQKWQLVACDSNEGKEADESSPDSSSDAPQKKRARTIKDLSAKQGKREVTSKRGGGASSSKAKGSAAKSGLKTKDSGGSDSKTISELFKKSDDSASKSKAQTPKGGNKAINLSKAANKTKDADSGTTKSTKPKDVEITPKTSLKTKQETPNTGKGKQANKSIGKTPKTGGGDGRSTGNGNSKVISGSSKVDEDEDMEDASSANSAEAPEIIQVQVKTTDSSNKQPRAGKKRRRGGKS